METHRIPVTDRESILLDWYPAQPHAPIAVFVHGLGSHRRGEKVLHFAARFNANGWGFAALDLRGHGESHGSVRELTLSRMLADLDVAMHWLRGHMASDMQPVLIGSSMGGAVIAWYAAAHPQQIGSLVMIAPALSFPTGIPALIGDAAMQAWRHSGVRRWRSEWIDLEIGYELIEDAVNYDPLALQHLACDMLILHGMRDDAVDWRASVAFAESHRSSCDVLLINQGDHRLTAQKSLLFDAAWAWLQRRSAP